VNPRGGTLFGEPVRTSLTDIDEPVDVVDVFRPSADTPYIAREAVAIGAHVLWLQLGIENDEARAIAEDAGLIRRHESLHGRHAPVAGAGAGAGLNAARGGTGARAIWAATAGRGASARGGRSTCRRRISRT